MVVEVVGGELCCIVLFMCVFDAFMCVFVVLLCCVLLLLCCFFYTSVAVVVVLRVYLGAFCCFVDKFFLSFDVSVVLL